MQTTQILDKLGYDRVLKGSRAFKDVMVGWNGCFLALIYGEEWELTKAFDCAGDLDMSTFAARKLGLTVNEVNWIVGAFDDKPEWLQQIVTRWLLANDPVNQKRVPQCPTLNGTTTQADHSLKSLDAPAHDSTIEKVVVQPDIQMVSSSSSLPIVPST